MSVTYINYSMFSAPQIVSLTYAAQILQLNFSSTKISSIFLCLDVCLYLDLPCLSLLMGQKTCGCNYIWWLHGIKKESILDHVYTDNVALVNDITFTVPTFGDHKLVIAKLTPKANLNCESIFKRNWKNYSPNNLIENITLPPLTGGDVQAIWNSLEHSLIIAADYVAPLILVNNNLKPKKNKTLSFELPMTRLI